MQFSVSLKLHLKIWPHYLTKNFYARRRWLVKMRPMGVVNDHNSFSNLLPTCSRKFWQKLPPCRQSGYPGCRQWAGPWPALRPWCNPSKRPPLSEAPGQEFGPPGLVSFVTTWNRQKGPESCRRSKQCDQQCDQMAGLLVQYSDIYNNENLPSIKNCSNGVKFWKIPSKIFAKSGHTGDHQNLTIYTKSNLPNSTKITQVPKFAKYNIKPS